MKFTLFLVSASLFGATFNCVSVGTGTANWSNPAAWGSCNSTYPNNGGGNVYTATIQTAVAMTLDVSPTVGVGGLAGTAAVTLSVAGSQLVFGSGQTLTLSGDLLNTYSSAGDLTDWVTATSGAGIVFDTTGGNRLVAPSGGYPNRFFRFDCSGGSACTITKTGANVASFTPPGWAGGLYLKNVTLTSLGSASVNAINWPSNGDYGNYVAVGNTFISCGLIGLNSSDGGTISTNTNAIHNYNRHTSTASTTPLSFGTYTSSHGTGTWEVVGNDFDKVVPNPAEGRDWKSITVEGNVFRGGLRLAANGRPMASFKGNLVRDPVQDPVFPSAAVEGNIFFFDYDTSNPHFFNTDQASSAITNNLFSMSGTDITGDCILPNGSAAGAVYTLTGNIVEPNRAWDSSCDLVTDFGSLPNARWVVDHNVKFGDSQAIIDTETSTQNLVAGSIQSFRSNMAQGTVTPGAAKILETSNCAGTMVADVISITACSGSACGDYNSGIGMKINVPCANATNMNQAGGYIQKYSTTPNVGVHDIDSSDLAFAGYGNLRLLVTAPTVYFGMTATRGAWTVSTVYSAADTATDSQLTVYNGSTILYKCILSTSGIADAVTRPGTGSSWRTYWEFAVVSKIADLSIAGTTITDSWTGAVADYPSKAIALWAQPIPSNPQLWCSGHDGEAVGAKPFCMQGKALLGAM
jgi:hypothetical protein